jgi:hypothetical protein
LKYHSHVPYAEIALTVANNAVLLNSKVPWRGFGKWGLIEYWQTLFGELKKREEVKALRDNGEAR